MTDMRLTLPDLNEEHERAKSRKYIEEAMLARWQANPPKRTPKIVQDARTYWRITCNVLTGLMLIDCAMCVCSIDLLDGMLAFIISVIPSSISDSVPDWFVRAVRYLDGGDA